MNKNNFWRHHPIPTILLVIMLGMSVTTTFFNTKLAIAFWGITLIATIVTFVWFRGVQKNIRTIVQFAEKKLRATEHQNLTKFPLPMIVTEESGNIVWYNERFRDQVPDRKDIYGASVSDIIGKTPEDFCVKPYSWVFWGDKYYKVYGVGERLDEKDLYIFYFVEETKLKKIYDEFEITRSVVMVLLIDNYEEVMQNAKESEKSRLLSDIDTALENFFGDDKGVLVKINSDRFVAVIEEQHLREMIQDRFSILDEAHKIKVNTGVAVTLSIGIGRTARSLSESETFARQGLEMALGRGGDQVAIHTGEGYEFYGGASKGYEKRTKVKTRIIANALSELISDSDNVIVMGHRFSDLDSVGAAVGIARAIANMGKTTSVAIDTNKTLAKPLIEYIEQKIADIVFIHPDVAMKQITKKTLLIIVDVHSPQLLESYDLYKACEHVVVIDHHRKMVNYVEDATIFFHEPGASSASEMVTELVQYLGEHDLIGSIEAEGLLAGMMLDTKSFAIRTGVRTFEAAAYLKKVGADPIVVKRLSTSKIDTYQRRTQLVSTAEIYKKCAITTASFASEDLRIVAPQAADELLTIEGVEASFVIFEVDDAANISARSMGEFNVQIIMESLGGGGHHTMSATQIKSTTVEKAKQLLLESIDNFLTEEEI